MAVAVRADVQDPLGGAAGEPRSRRNVTIDILRGFCIVMMVASHTGTNTWANTLMHPFRFVSGAEGFVFLSGLVLGMVYRRRLDAAPARAAYVALWRRAGVLWAAHCVVVLAALILNAAIMHLPDLPSPARLGWASTVLLTLTLQLQPAHALNVLPLYVLLLLAAPVALELLRRGRTGWLVAASGALLLTHQALPHAGRWAHPAGGGDAFPLFGWQALFMGGLVVGYHSALIRSAVLAPRRAALRWALLAALAAAMVCVWVQTPDFAFYDHERWDLALWERSPLRLGRLAYFALAVSAAYLLAQWLRSRLSVLRVPLDALALLGRNSLYAFLVHLGIALGLAALRVPPQAVLLAELLPLAAVAAVYALARGQVGRRWIPN